VADEIRNKIALAALALFCGSLSSAAELHINDLDMQGLSVLVRCCPAA
jgi:hypothetical protein